jgi:RNA polymerase sigma-70 factor (ECF subfamily)
MRNSPTDATKTLTACATGDPDAAAELVPLIYAELRALARALMRGERADHTLQPTALVHEAYARLVDIRRVDWQGKAHFLAMAARQMRRVLVEHARKAGRQKRGSGRRRVTLADDLAVVPGSPVEILAVHEALEALAGDHPRRARVVELRFFGGLSATEIAHLLGVSERTVQEDWRLARIRLARELGHAAGGKTDE